MTNRRRPAVPVLAEPSRRLRFFQNMVAFPDQQGDGGSDRAIPSVVYQTGKSRLVSQQQFGDMVRFRELNRSLAFVFFDDDEMNRYMQEEWGDHPIFDMFSRAIFPQMKADIFRYCIIFERGGFYCDLNKGVFADLQAFGSKNTELLISFEQNDCIVFPDPKVVELLQHPTKVLCQWAFAAKSRHPVFGALIEEIPKVLSTMDGITVPSVKDAILMSTGPGLFTRAVRRHLLEAGTTNVHQAGIDFDRTGRYRLRGTELNKSMAKEHYAKVRSQTII